MEFVSRDDENNVLSAVKKQIPLETFNSSLTKRSQKAKDVLKKEVSKEFKIDVSKSFEKNNIVQLAIAKEEFVQLQKAALELEMRTKEEHNNIHKKKFCKQN